MTQYFFLLSVQQGITECSPKEDLKNPSFVLENLQFSVAADLMDRIRSLSCTKSRSNIKNN